MIVIPVKIPNLNMADRKGRSLPDMVTGKRMVVVSISEICDRTHRASGKSHRKN